MKARTEPEVLALKVPPHSQEAEQSLIGGLLLDNRAFDQVSWLAPNAFYEDRHRRIWPALVRLLEAGKEADVVTVGEALGEDAEKVGGIAYLGALAQNTPSALNIRRYAELVYERWVQRELANVGNDIAEGALSKGSDVAGLLEEAERRVLAIRDAGRAGKTDWVHISEAATEYLDFLEEHPNGIETGFKALDALTGGLLPGNVVVIAGRPSMGKTALALQFCDHICGSVPGFIFSLDQTRRELAGRLIEWHKHRIGRDAAVDKVFRLKTFIDDSGSMTLGAMRARLRRMKREHGLSLVVVDYLQQMRGEGDSREQEVSSISRGLKAMAKEFKVPVVALAQLSREVEKRTDKRPNMSDLRESGAIEQDADVILFPFRPDYYDQKFEGNLAEAEIIVAKNKNNGRTGLCKVLFSRDLNRFGDWIPEMYRTGT